MTAEHEPRTASITGAARRFAADAVALVVCERNPAARLQKMGDANGDFLRKGPST